MPGAGTKSRTAPKRKRQQKDGAPMPLLPPEVPDDDIQISDEDVQFVKDNRSYAGLFAGLDTKSITKQVLGLKPNWEGDNLEKYYEKSGKAKSSLKEAKLSVDPVDALPIKTLDGELQYRKTSIKKIEKTGDKEIVEKTKGKKEKDAVSEEQKKKKKQKIKHDEKTQDEPSTRLSALEELKTFVSEEERRSELKAQIAELATELLSNPEGSTSSLKTLLDLCADKDETLSQLAMLSLVAVFKDIVPGYRIRAPTEKELEMQVSKEVQQIRDFERSLLRSYQNYVQRLIKASKASSSQFVAVRCICGLIEGIPHFNYRESLLGAVIPFTNSTDIRCRELACAALKSLFRYEGKHGGEATAEAVELIADFVKVNDCQLHPDVLQAFLALTFDEELGKSSLKEEDSKGRKWKGRRGKRESKVDQKTEIVNELKKEVEEDFKEAAVKPDVAERRRLQTLTLSAVFETYFRILKRTLGIFPANGGGNQNSNPHSHSDIGDHPLLGICLDGLLKFSHLISIEFFGDLLVVLRKLASGKSAGNPAEYPESSLTVDERMQCCTAAFKIMRVNLDALNIDLKDFYVIFYNLLLEYIPISDKQNGVILANALQSILCDTRQHDMQRVAAFIKRLAAVCVHLGSGCAMSALVTIRLLLLRYKQARNLLENDGGGGGGGGGVAVYEADGCDPDLSGALNTLLWELCIMEKHYNPDIAKLSREIMSMGCSESLLHSNMSPADAIATYSTDEGGFRPRVKLPVAKPFKRKSFGGKRVTKGDDEVAVDVEFGSYFKVLRDIRQNDVLRKEHLRTKAMMDLYESYKLQKKKKITKR